MASYLRFVCPRSGTGIFQASAELLEGADVSAADRVELETLLRWFSSNLAEPDRLVRTTSKGRYRREPVAVCWFKDSAEECLRRARAISAILERNGVAVDFVRCNAPGYVTYEDDQQIAAIPFADR